MNLLETEQEHLKYLFNLNEAAAQNEQTPENKEIEPFSTSEANECSNFDLLTDLSDISSNTFAKPFSLGLAPNRKRKVIECSEDKFEFERPFKTYETDLQSPTSPAVSVDSAIDLSHDLLTVVDATVEDSDDDSLALEPDSVTEQTNQIEKILTTWASYKDSMNISSILFQLNPEKHFKTPMLPIDNNESGEKILDEQTISSKLPKFDNKVLDANDIIKVNKNNIFSGKLLHINQNSVKLGQDFLDQDSFEIDNNSKIDDNQFDASKNNYILNSKPCLQNLLVGGPPFDHNLENSTKCFKNKCNINNNTDDTINDTSVCSNNFSEINVLKDIDSNKTLDSTRISKFISNDNDSLRMQCNENLSVDTKASCIVRLVNTSIHIDEPILIITNCVDELDDVGINFDDALVNDSIGSENKPHSKKTRGGSIDETRINFDNRPQEKKSSCADQSIDTSVNSDDHPLETKTCCVDELAETSKHFDDPLASTKTSYLDKLVNTNLDSEQNYVDFSINSPSSAIVYYVPLPLIRSCPTVSCLNFSNIHCFQDISSKAVVQDSSMVSLSYCKNTSKNVATTASNSHVTAKTDVFADLSKMALNGASQYKYEKSSKQSIYKNKKNKFVLHDNNITNGNISNSDATKIAKPQRKKTSANSINKNHTSVGNKYQTPSIQIKDVSHDFRDIQSKKTVNSFISASMDNDIINNRVNIKTELTAVNCKDLAVSSLNNTFNINSHMLPSNNKTNYKTKNLQYSSNGTTNKHDFDVSPIVAVPVSSFKCIPVSSSRCGVSLKRRFKYSKKLL